MIHEIFFEITYFVNTSIFKSGLPAGFNFHDEVVLVPRVGLGEGMLVVDARGEDARVAEGGVADEVGAKTVAKPAVHVLADVHGVFSGNGAEVRRDVEIADGHAIGRIQHSPDNGAGANGVEGREDDVAVRKGLAVEQHGAVQGDAGLVGEKAIGAYPVVKEVRPDGVESGRGGRLGKEMGFDRHLHLAAAQGGPQINHRGHIVFGIGGADEEGRRRFGCAGLGRTSAVDERHEIGMAGGSGHGVGGVSGGWRGRIEGGLGGEDAAGGETEQTDAMGGEVEIVGVRVEVLQRAVEVGDRGVVGRSGGTGIAHHKGRDATGIKPLRDRRDLRVGKIARERGTGNNQNARAGVGSRRREKENREVWRAAEPEDSFFGPNWDGGRRRVSRKQCHRQSEREQNWSEPCKPTQGREKHF